MTADSLIRCRDHIKAALVAEQEHRSEHLDWIERERAAVAIAACEWAEAHGLEVRPTVADVERIEPMAVGHVDYTPKLALYVAEFVTAAEARR